MHPTAPRRVLIPTDLSGLTAHAASWARALGAKDAIFQSVYVHESAPATLLGLAPAPLSMPDKRRILDKMSLLIPEAKPHIDVGDPVGAILRRAEHADFVAMGSHGREGLDRAVLGSVAEGILRECPVPVLAARASAEGVRSVLVPVNLTPYSFQGLALAAFAAERLKAELVVLHIAAPGSEAVNPKSFLNGMIARLPSSVKGSIEIRITLRSGKPVPQILTESTKHGLVVLTAHRKSLLTDMILGTTAERVLRHSPVPILTAPSKDTVKRR